MVGMVALLVCAPLACGSLLGIDSGTPRGDASALGDERGLDDVAAIDASQEDVSSTDGGSSVDAGSTPDAGPGVDGAGCTPDLNWCDTHCGSGPDNCNQTRQCSSVCPAGESCISSTCQCQSDPAWCNGRCEKTTDNCGNGVQCGNCDGGVACYSGFCGCMPDPLSTTCAGKQCGSATNNCNLAVNCGVNSSPSCAAGDYCKSDDTCCTPDDTAACGGRCQVSIANNCGVAVPCPLTCPGNQECVNTTCCTPTGCAGICLDSCGVKSAACCPPDAGKPPPDSGLPPPDAGGGCGVPGSPCSWGCCSGLFCGYSDTCVMSCQGSGAACSSSTECCYGLTCSPGVVTAAAATSQGLGVPDSGIIPLQGTCQ